MTALIYAPFPDAGAAEEVAAILLDEKLVVCANIGAAVRSLFEWNGTRGNEMEVGVLFKTDCAILDRAVERLETLHPYQEPAIFGWPCMAVGTATRKWTGQLVGGNESA